MNERKTEAIVRKHFDKFSNIIIEEQKSDNPKTIIVSTDGQGSHTYSYVCPVEFVPNSNVCALIPKQDMDLKTKIYYAMIITKKVRETLHAIGRLKGYINMPRTKLYQCPYCGMANLKDVEAVRNHDTWECPYCRCHLETA